MAATLKYAFVPWTSRGFNQSSWHGCKVTLLLITFKSPPSTVTGRSELRVSGRAVPTEMEDQHHSRSRTLQQGECSWTWDRGLVRCPLPLVLHILHNYFIAVLRGRVKKATFSDCLGRQSWRCSRLF